MGEKARCELSGNCKKINKDLGVQAPWFPDETETGNLEEQMDMVDDMMVRQCLSCCSYLWICIGYMHHRPRLYIRHTFRHSPFSLQKNGNATEEQKKILEDQRKGLQVECHACLHACRLSAYKSYIQT